MHEQHRRSVAKAVSWRFFATLDTIILAYVFTGNIAAAFSIGGLEVLTKVAWYYLHERAWLFLGPEGGLHITTLLGYSTRTRSLLKAVSWRLVGALDTVFISLLITRHLDVSLSIGGTELVTKILLYYLHERLWLNIPWGLPEPATPIMPQSRLAALSAVFIKNVVFLKQIAKAAGYSIACVVFLLLMAALAYIVHSN